MISENLLETIKGPDDLRKLNKEQTDRLCAEIRQRLIETVSLTGGHLASNLGVVELTVALHTAFHSPLDQIVWDVGHQSYVHKLLTGRADRFSTLRQYGGISGFAKPCESEHDVYGAGHSSTSISAALGLATAKALKKEEGYVVAVTGDGALTGGLSYEGLNNAGRTREKLIIVLNDNKMSISKNVGAMARHLAVIRAKPFYFRLKDATEYVLAHTSFVGRILRKAINASKTAIKNYFYHSTIFEEMGFAYLGPVDGHNVDEIVRLLNRAKEIKRPAFVHVMTVKGKGYTYAEHNPRAFHGVSKFDVETGDFLAPSDALTFSDAFGSMLCTLAHTNDKICAITAAMATGTGLTEFASKYKNRFFDVGIAEEHAVVFAAGLAKNGMIPVFSVYSTFLQRSYDQIIHDVALQGLKVLFAVDRAGIVGEDGETHQGLFDVALFNCIPGMTIFSPATIDELTNFITAAVYECKGPVAVRYPRGSEPKLPADFRPTFRDYDLYGEGKADILLVTYGRLFGNAVAARDILMQKGYEVSILKLNKIKPIHPDCYELASYFNRVFCFEEAILTGGIGEHFCMKLNQRGYPGQIRAFGVDDRFVEHGNTEILMKICGLDPDGIAETILAAIRNNYRE